MLKEDQKTVKITHKPIRRRRKDEAQKGVQISFEACRKIIIEYKYKR